MSDRRISVRIDEQLDQKLGKLARDKGKSESELIREAIADLVDREAQQPSAYDVLKRLGVIGCVKGTPRDLSTNKKHFEGFGQ